MSFLAKAGKDSSPPGYLSTSHSSSSFSTQDFTCFFPLPATGFVGLLLSCQNDKSTLSKQTFLTWTTISTIREIILLAQSGEMGSKSTEKHEITEMHFFFFLHFPPCLASANYLCASYTLYTCLMFHPPLRLTIRGSFSIPPLPLSSLCPCKFPGDFISPISNRIGTQFAMPHVTLLENSTLDIDTS